jgi:hypothetical protein
MQSTAPPQLMPTLAGTTRSPGWHGLRLAARAGSACELDARLHDGLPRVVPAADSEAGWREALAKLAALVETG